MIKVRRPANLIPYTFRCSQCNSIVGYSNKTDSYYLIKEAKGGIKGCKFCYNLLQAAIPEAVGHNKE